MNARIRILWTLAALAAGALALTGWVDTLGEEHAERAFARALVTFAVARTLNGVISVAQGTELALEPAGVGMIFSLGQILDPINDLVERFSTVMLVATSSLGLQNLLLKITGWWGTTALLIATAAAVILSVWWPRRAATAASDPSSPPGHGRLARISVRLLLIAVFLRFAVPLLIIGTSLVFDTFLATEQQAAEQALIVTTEEIEAVQEEVTPPAPPPEESMFDRFGSWLDRSLDSLDMEKRLEGLGDRVSQATEHIINLIVIFVLQTVLLPLVFLWLLVEALKGIARRATGL